MERGDSRLGLSVRIARSRVAALARNAAFYSSLADVGPLRAPMRTHHEPGGSVSAIAERHGAEDDVSDRCFWHLKLLASLSMAAP